METRNSYSLIKIGLAIRLLRHIQAGTPKEFLINNLEILNKSLKENQFSVSLIALDQCEKIAGKINVSGEDTINQTQINEFTTTIDRLEITVFSEAVTKTIYVLEQRRFSTEFLLNEPYNLLGEGEFERLSDIARQDIQAACKCLLFGLSTATAFHILRATEEVLRLYYFKHKKRNRLTKLMWGPIIEELRKKRTGRPSGKLLNALDNVRVSYRNPTQHPEATYDLTEAQNLFGLCLDVISQMSKELK